MELILNKTSIPEEMKIKMRTDASYDWDPNDTEDLYKILFIGISKYLGFMKSKEAGSTALIINDYKGNLLMGAIVRYTENEENPNMPGNWNLSYTINKEDLNDVANKYYSEDRSFHKVIVDVGRDVCSMNFYSIIFIEDFIKFNIMVLMEALDKNAKVEEEVEIVQPGLFLARVKVEDGIKLMSIEPGDKSKQIIKDDAAIAV